MSLSLGQDPCGVVIADGLHEKGGGSQMGKLSRKAAVLGPHGGVELKSI